MPDAPLADGVYVLLERPLSSELLSFQPLLANSPLIEYLIKSSSDFGWFLLVILLLIPLEAVWGASKRPAWSERIGNLGAMLVLLLVGGSIVYLCLVNTGFVTWIGMPMESRLAFLNNPWLYALVAIAVIDGLYYILHRLQHAIPLLWRFHKVHHTEPAINITTSHRSHFLEAPLQFVVVLSLALFILGYNQEGLIYAQIATKFFSYFGHLDIRLFLGPLSGVVVGPQYHRLHHSITRLEQDSNFAQVLPLWDWIGRTYRRPQPGEFPDTGVEGCESAGERWRPLLW